MRSWVPLPKSVTAERIKANADIYDFDLSKDEMAVLDGLNKGEGGTIGWNPVSHRP